MQHSSSGNTILDTLCERELKKRDSASRIVSVNEVFNEFPGGGNPLYDVSGSWGNIPMVSIARALPQDDLDFPFRGYLTDFDSLENADFNAIKETCSIVKAIFNALEDT
jgi:hypothetical protein